MLSACGSTVLQDDANLNTESAIARRSVNSKCASAATAGASMPGLNSLSRIWLLLLRITVAALYYFLVFLLW
jgi:hypothetical protein